MVDALSSIHQWSTATVVEPFESIENPFPKIKVGYRQYHEYGEKTDEMGPFDGSSSQLDEVIPVYSVRIQKPFSMMKVGGEQLGNTCRKVTIPTSTGASDESNTQNTFVDYKAR